MGKNVVSFWVSQSRDPARLSRFVLPWTGIKSTFKLPTKQVLRMLAGLMSFKATVS
jgi:hypothetical protein